MNQFNYETPAPLTPEGFLEFVRALNEIRPVQSVCAGNYSVAFAQPDPNIALGNSIKEAAAMVSGRHLAPVK